MNKESPLRILSFFFSMNENQKAPEDRDLLGSPLKVFVVGKSGWSGSITVHDVVQRSEKLDT